MLLYAHKFSKLQPDMYRDYYGNPDTLNQFINNCDFLFLTYAGREKTKVVLSKLTTEPTCLLVIALNLMNGHKSKRHFSSFGDQQSLLHKTRFNDC